MFLGNILRNIKKITVFFLIFLFILSIFTFPLIFKFSSVIPGFFSSDEPFSCIWDSWRIKYSIIHNINLKVSSLIAHPFGVEMYGNYISYVWGFVFYALSLLTNKILAYNLQIVINLILNALFAYSLFFYVAKNKYAAFFTGLTFSLCPYEIFRTWQHIGLTYNQWLPLVLLSSIVLKENYSKKSWLFLFTSLFMALSFDWSVAYMVFISAALLLIYCLARETKKSISFVVRFLTVNITVLFVFLPQFLPFFVTALRNRVSPSAFNIYHRPFEDLFMQSAKPLSYLLPSVAHPLFGNFTEHFIGTNLYGISFTEHTLYLGWIPLILAFIAYKNRKKINNFYLGFFIFLALAAWFFSQPPWWKIGTVKIYMPSFFMYKILPMFRAYCRFGIVVMLAVAVLAGFGLKFILERFKTQKAKIAVTSLFCGLVLFEFWNYPPFKVIDVSKVPAVYYWLKNQPKDIVIAEYPLDADSPNEMYKFYQTEHEKKIINGTIPGTYANKVAQTIKKLSEPNTVGILRWMGVKYVLVHKEEYLKTGLVEEIEEINKIPKNSGLKLIGYFPAQECSQKDIMCVQKTGPIDVYEIDAVAIKPELKEK